MFSKLGRWSAISLLLVESVFASFALAQPFPSRPIRLIVPFAAGGSMDITARLLGQKMGEILGKPVIVDNRPGGSGTIGSQLVATANPDGYTLMLTSASHTVNPSLFSKLPYDTAADFTPISLVVTLPLVFVAHPNAHITSLAEFLTKAKANPGVLSFGSSGNGGAAQLAGEQLKLSTGIDMVHVPYKGGGPAVNDVVAGQIPLLFNSIPPLLPFIKSGQVIPLAVTSAKRSPLLPDVPTFVEAGLPTVVLVEWAGLFGPAKLPPETVATLRNAVAKALTSPDITQKLIGLGGEPVGSTPEEFGAFLNSEIPKMAKIVKASGAHID
jgi:tripartite-type tricarboxylate transporter receptor subunit TctC